MAAEFDVQFLCLFLPTHSFFVGIDFHIFIFCVYCFSPIHFFVCIVFYPFIFFVCIVFHPFIFGRYNCIYYGIDICVWGWPLFWEWLVRNIITLINACWLVHSYFNINMNSSQSRNEFWEWMNFPEYFFFLANCEQLPDWLIIFRLQQVAVRILFISSISYIFLFVFFF